MKGEIQRMLSASRALRVLRLAAVIFPVAFAAHGAEFLELGEITFDPPYVEARGTRQVAVQVELLQNASGAQVLQLEELIPLGEGGERVERLAALRDDGTGADQIAGDSVFSGHARFDEAFCSTRRLRVSDPGAGLISASFGLPSARTYLANAELVGTQVLGVPESETIVLDETGPEIGRAHV